MRQGGNSGSSCAANRGPWRRRSHDARRGPRAPSSALPARKGFMFDVDGTLLLSDRTLGGYEVLPGAIEVLTALQRRGMPFVLFTNGSAYPPAEQARRSCAHVGLPVEDEQMLTPSSVAADLMRRRGVRRALVLGSRGVGEALREARHRNRVHRRAAAHRVCRPCTSAGIRSAA